MTLILAVNKLYIFLCFLLPLYKTNLVVVIYTINSGVKIIEKKYKTLLLFNFGIIFCLMCLY